MIDTTFMNTSSWFQCLSGFCGPIYAASGAVCSMGTRRPPPKIWTNDSTQKAIVNITEAALQMSAVVLQATRTDSCVSDGTNFDRLKMDRRIVQESKHKSELRAPVRV